MTERKQTELPWAVATHTEEDFGTKSDWLSIRRSDGKDVLARNVTDFAERKRREFRDDFEFIARAVNSHYPLVEALEGLLCTAKILRQNAEGCAVNHYGNDFELHGMPGWLADCQKDIEAASAALAKARGDQS